jgi:hypothetical protein
MCSDSLSAMTMIQPFSYPSPPKDGKLWISRWWLQRVLDATSPHVSDANDTGSCSNQQSPGLTPRPVKQDRVASLRVKNCPASEAEWEDILQHVLRQDPIPDIHASAVVETGSSISLTIRKQIQGITVSPYTKITDIHIN